MKGTILSEKDTVLLEQVILKYGQIVTIGNLLTIFKTEYSKSAAHNRIQKLSTVGWLKRIKRGVYLIIDSLSSRHQNDKSLLHISNYLDQNSYISLSSALNYYNMFDQYSNIVSAITTGNSKKYHFDNLFFKFTKVKENMYFGFSKKLESDKLINIADAEKALIDYLYLDKSFTSASLVFEKLKDYQQNLDLKKLQHYALKSGTTIKRKIGFLLDQLTVDTDKLYQGLATNKGSSRFTKESSVFNAKWRLYYDNRIIG